MWRPSRRGCWRRPSPAPWPRPSSPLPVQVGAKTGSAQVDGEETSNAVLVCFAPYEDPEIALAVVVEQGGSGSSLGTVAAQVIQAYVQ
ncbi:MAG: penicillin-binding transpeptidase domain-containing protein [Evtepia gabavorous]